jgi:hypothetical protein
MYNMSTNTQIRITKTAQIAKILSAIQSHYVLLDDVDIIKMSLSNQYKLIPQTEEETEYLTKSVNNKLRIDQAIQQENSKSRKFSNLNELSNELRINN